MSNHSYPVQIRGKVYPSVKEAADAVGVKPGAIRTALSRGRIDHVGCGRGKAPQRRHGISNGVRKEITLGGRTFPSYRALSRFLGKSDGYVAYALARNQLHRIVRAFREAVAKEQSK